MKYWLLSLISVSAMAQELVRVRSHIVAKPESQITLAQLLDLSGTTPALESQAKLINVSIAPAIGERLEISNAAITSLLRPVVADERTRTRADVKVSVPQRVLIDTVKRAIEQSEVKEELYATWRPLCQDCEIEIQNLSLPKVDNIVDWTLKLDSKIPRGSFAVPVEIMRENQSPLKAWINGSLKIRKRVPVAKRLILAGERLAATDIGHEKIDVTYALDSNPSAKEIIGRKTKLSLRLNDPIWANALEQDKAVKRGETVRVSSSSGIWEVAINLTAQGDATIGETVELKNPRTNKLLTGIVVAQGEVELR